MHAPTTALPFTGPGIRDEVTGAWEPGWSALHLYLHSYTNTTATGDMYLTRTGDEGGRARQLLGVMFLDERFTNLSFSFHIAGGFRIAWRREVDLRGVMTGSAVLCLRVVVQRQNKRRTAYERVLYDERSDDEYVEAALLTGDRMGHEPETALFCLPCDLICRAMTSGEVTGRVGICAG